MPIKAQMFGLGDPMIFWTLLFHNVLFVQKTLRIELMTMVATEATT